MLSSLKTRFLSKKRLPRLLRMQRAQQLMQAIASAKVNLLSIRAKMASNIKPTKTPYGSFSWFKKVVDISSNVWHIS